MNMIEASRARQTHRRRIKAALEALSRIMRAGVRERREAVKILMKTYNEMAVQPIRGKAWPPDIWDKEMATLYVLAKHVLHGYEREPDLMHSLFGFEEVMEDAGSAVLETGDTEQARKILLFYLGGDVSDNTIARLLRVFLTEATLGYRSLEDVEKLIKKLASTLPEKEQTLRKYTRFYIALVVAQLIAAGLIRNRIVKEAVKQAIAARVGMKKSIPDDEYIGYIARNVFEVPKRRLAQILGQQGGEEEGRQPRVHRPSRHG